MAHLSTLRLRRRLLATCLLGATIIRSHALAAAGPTDGETLRAALVEHYPSLAWVERYRQAYPAEVQGDAWWKAADVPALQRPGQLVDALTALQDQHVALTGAQAGKAENLGILFRTSSDGAMSVWRHLDTSVTAVRDGEQVVAVDGLPAARWLERAARTTFGGNRRSRMAEAALKLGIGTPFDHATAGLGKAVRLDVRGADGATRTVDLPYRPNGADTGAALAQALERPDLPELVQAHGVRVGIVRFGAFAPQYDPDFNAAATAAEGPGAGEDGPMLAGFCAVVRKRLAQVDALAARADVLLIDVRGNFGGFAREGRLLARALTRQPLPRTYDVARGSAPGHLQLVEQHNDPSCGTIATPRPLLVWSDAGTRSSGEFMAAWLWGAGAIAVGERTIGAGGGMDSQAQGIPLPQSGLGARFSETFSVLDNGTTIKAGETGEVALLDVVAQDRFAPSRTRPFAFQGVGLQPDLPVPTTAADLADGGAAAVLRIVAQLVQRGLIGPYTR